MSSLVYKYIPKKCDDLAGHRDIKETIKKVLNDGLDSMPNLLFSGRAGIGKTTLAYVIAYHFFGDNPSNNFIEYNGSDDRGIDFVRNEIKSIVSVKPMSNKKRIILLDEMDNLTSSAQDALKRIIEQYYNNVIFIFTCNTPSKIIEPIKSRTTHFEFTPIKPKEIAYYLNDICKKENINIDNYTLASIAKSCNGDIRKALNNLEKAKYGQKSFSMPDDILSLSFFEFRSLLDKNDINTIRELIFDQEVIKKKRYKLVKKIADMDYRIAVGSDSKIQILNLFLEAKGE